MLWGAAKTAGHSYSQKIPAFRLLTGSVRARRPCANDSRHLVTGRQAWGHVGLFGQYAGQEDTKGSTHRYSSGEARSRRLDSAHGVDDWVNELETVIGATSEEALSHGRQVPHDQDQTGARISTILHGAYAKANTDLLCHLAFTNGRWSLARRAFDIMIKDVALSGQSDKKSLLSFTQKLYASSTTLDEWTNNAIKLATDDTAADADVQAVDEFTNNPLNLKTLGPVSANQILRTIWRSLSAMILAADDDNRRRYREIMPHVLEILASLHNRGLVPNGIYDFNPEQESGATRQPPYLHLLSTRILTALSDAAWKMNSYSHLAQTQWRVPEIRSMGFLVPSTFYANPLPELIPAVWLEFVLWSCIKGGQNEAVVDILLEVQKRKGENSWTFDTWLDSYDGSPSLHLLDWTQLKDFYNSEALEKQPRKSKEEKLGRSLSSEIVLACMDSILNKLSVGIGQRGERVALAVSRLSELQANLSATAPTSYELNRVRIILRLWESQALDVATDAAFAEKLFSNTAAHPMSKPMSRKRGGASAAAAKTATSAEVGLKYQVLLAHLRSGDARSTLSIFTGLMKELEVAPEPSLASDVTAGKERLDSDEQLQPILMRISPALVASVLETTTEAGMLNVGRWLIYGNEAGRGLLNEALIGHKDLAPSLVRYATASGDHPLLRKLFKLHTSHSEEGSYYILPLAMQAFLESQIKRHSWVSVEAILQLTSGQFGSGWELTTLTVLLRQMLSLERSQTKAGSSEGGSEDRSSLASVSRIFRNIVGARYPGCSAAAGPECYAITGMLCYLSPHWATEMAPILTEREQRSHKLQLPLHIVDKVVGAIVDSYGSDTAKRVVESCCRPLSTPRREGGVVAMSRIRPILGADRVRNRIVVGQNGGTTVFWGGMVLSQSTVWLVLRAAVNERLDRRAGRSRPATISWAINTLRHLGVGRAAILDEIRRLERQ